MERVIVPVPDGVEIGLLAATEEDQLYALVSGVVARYEGFPQLPPLSRHGFEGAFLNGARAVVVARVGTVLAGAYYLRPNGPGRAAHVANAGYVVEPVHRRRGIGRALVADSIVRAAALGFEALQFNLVFASNPARSLYEELGFVEIGRIPGAVAAAADSPREDAIVYWRSLEPRPAPHAPGPQ